MTFTPTATSVPAPVIEVGVQGSSPNYGNWMVGPVTTYVYVSNASTSDITSVKYSLDGGALQNAALPGADGKSTVVVTSDGPHVIFVQRYKCQRHDHKIVGVPDRQRPLPH